jgi:dTDP-L-rhamnose 4-epimerase
VSRVLVTGGAGFVGSHLVDALLDAGEEVRVLDNLDPLAHSEGMPAHVSADAELLIGDLRHRAAVDRALEGVDRVFHLGGVVGNGESMINVRRAVDANSAGTATLLEAVLDRRDRIRRLVAASSMVVYGEGAYRCPAHGNRWPARRSAARLGRREWEPRCDECDAELTPVPTKEDAPLQPASVYGITKRDQEELVLVLGRAYGLETVPLRYLNVYGPRQALSNPYTGVAAIFAARLLGGKPPLVFEDGRQIRDLVHVGDVVEATRLAMDAPDAPWNPINVATGRQVRVGELARRLARALGVEIEPQITGEARTGDIRHCYADVTRARDLLGFQARRGLGEGLAELAGWLADQRVDDRGAAALADLRARGLVS